MKIVKNKSTENCHFYSCEKLLYIAWACFRNGASIAETTGYSFVCFQSCEEIYSILYVLVRSYSAR